MCIFRKWCWIVQNLADVLRYYDTGLNSRLHLYNNYFLDEKYIPSQIDLIEISRTERFLILDQYSYI